MSMAGRSGARTKAHLFRQHGRNAHGVQSAKPARRRDTLELSLYGLVAGSERGHGQPDLAGASDQAAATPWL